MAQKKKKPGEARGKEIKIPANQAEKELLDRAAAKYGIPRAQYIRERIFPIARADVAQPGAAITPDHVREAGGGYGGRPWEDSVLEKLVDLAQEVATRRNRT